MIQIQNLTKKYGSTVAVDNLSVGIPKGEVLGLLGPNGAGKSTTIRVITGYLPSTSGTVEVDGQSVAENPRAAKELMGYLPESAPLYDDMMVFDYLDCIANLRGIAKPDKMKRLRELSGLCGIRDVMHKSISALSKGYRQRVGLALAMMNDPPILILDEPTSGLDPNQIAEIRSIIKEIGREKTIIFSTHILSEAEAACDRVLIVNKGRVVADGSADSLKASLAAERTLHLRLGQASDEDVRNSLQDIEGVISLDINAPDEGENDGELEVILKSAEDLRANIYNAVKKRDWTMLEMVQKKQSLEDIFRELTREDTQ